MKKKIKSINELSPREQRIKRKRWRQNSQRYQERKKKERKIQEVVVKKYTVDEDDAGNQPDPLRETIKKERTEIEIKLRKRIRALIVKHAREKNQMLLVNKELNRKLLIMNKKLKKIEITANAKNNPKKGELGPYDSTTMNLRKTCLRRQQQQKIQQSVHSIQQLIINYYEDDINSRITSGKKQYIKKHGQLKQKRYLLDTIKNLHKKFLEEYPNLRLSYVTFSRLRPLWVLLPLDDRDTCACAEHTNLNLLISALHKNKIVDIKNTQDMLDILCCDKYKLHCVARKCEHCKNKGIPYKQFENTDIEYKEWNKGKKKVGHKEINIIKKFTKKTDTRNLIQNLENSLPKFLSHTVNILNQYQSMKELKESLNDHEVLISHYFMKLRKR